MKRALSKLAGLLAVVLLLSALSMTASAADTTLSFTAPSGVTFQLYSAQKNFGSTTGKKVNATSTATAEGITTYSYAGLAAGNYYYTAAGDGYYTVKKNVYYSEDEAAVGGTIDANPGKLAGNNFEPAGGIVVNDHTDELNAAANQSAKDTWPGYEQIFDTPYFTRADYAQRMSTGNGKHQQTTQEEMMTFLDEVDDENDNVYTYILGRSPKYNYDIPILVFTKTDLSGAKSLEEAAELVRGNGKLTFHISAEVHSDEPASANKTYGASFDTTTVPGVLILMAHGIAAKEMHDDITFTVKKGDEVWYQETMSVYDVAKLWHEDADTSDQRMLADMIAYGNEARKEFNYNMAGQSTLPTLTGASGYVPAWNATQGAGVSNGQSGNVAVTLSLKDQIELNVCINDKAAQVSDVNLADSAYDAVNYTVDTSSGRYTRICFHNIPVVRVKDAVVFTVTLSNGETFEVKYSIADYAVLAKDGEQSALIRALMRYVDGVRAFLGETEDEDYMIIDPQEDETIIVFPWIG